MHTQEGEFLLLLNGPQMLWNSSCNTVCLPPWCYRPSATQLWWGRGTHRTAVLIWR